MTDQEDLSRFTTDHYRLATEAVGIGFWDWDLLQNTQIWTNQCKHLLGWQPGDAMSYQSFLARLYPADREHIGRQILDCLAQHREYESEYRVIWPDESLHWMHSRGRGIYDPSGKPVRMLGVLFEVTARKIAEQERDRLLAQERTARVEAETARQQSEDLIAQLERRKTFFKAVVNQAPCGLFIAEAPGGRVIIANKESSKILGHELIQCNSVEEYTQYHAFHPDGRPYLAEEYPLARGLTGEVVMQEHALYRQGDGTMIHLSNSAAPIRDSSGHILASVTTFNDVSEHYELERQKDEFITMASHELRTPLTSVKGNIQLMQRRLQRLLELEASATVGKRDIEHLMRWTERVLRQINVENRLLNDLLDASAIQTGELRVLLEPGDLVQVVQDAVRDIQAATDTRTLSLVMPDQPAIPVLIDRVRIGQVVTNYVLNALKYSPAPQPVTTGITLNKHEARVWVQDAGPGLSPQEQQYIWERFSQVGNFANYLHLGGGLGLSLYISHRLIQLHGGHSGVKSTVGKGSTFWFTLPLAES